jgi:hypothetical protein
MGRHFRHLPAPESHIRQTQQRWEVVRIKAQTGLKSGFSLVEISFEETGRAQMV